MDFFEIAMCVVVVLLAGGYKVKRSLFDDLNKK